ncbi:MAG: Coq4 family protein [Actinomycetota bacterium]
MSEPIVDRTFAEKFLTAVDRPFDYGVYFLFHDWWAEAPQDAIDAYHRILLEAPGARDFLDRRHLAEPIALADLEACAPGTLGHGYHAFITENGLEANLATNYRDFNEKLQSSGALDRLPEDLSYMIVRGFQIHDFLHVLTGFSPKPLGELAQAAFHFAQLRFPYHAMRVAVTTGHMAFVNPEMSAKAMDALVDGWVVGRSAENCHFTLWEEELDTPLAELRERMSIVSPRLTAAAA